MTDPVLASRLESLSQNLNRLHQSVKLIDKVPLEQASAEELFDHVQREIDDEIHYGKREIEAIHKLLASKGGDGEQDPLAEAWERYAALEAKTRSLFRGCLELIGGVAFREKGQFDQDVWRVADAFNVELCRQALKQSFNYLTVPALEEALTGSMVRTIRVRFPEWSVWSLPLVGYEFGHAAVSARDEFEKLVDDHVARLVGSNEPLGKLAAAKDPLLDRHKRLVQAAYARRIRALFADAIAMYMLGPCYACATIHLRLDPASASATSAATSDERARVVLACLRAMAKDDTLEGEDEIIKTLEAQWKEAVQRSRPPGLDDAARLADLQDTLLPAFVDALSYLPKAARLTGPSWVQAMKFRKEWADQLKASDPLELELAPSHQLRDVLNAAWLIRVQDPQHAEKVEAAALGACVSLLELRDEARAAAADRGHETVAKIGRV